MDTRPGGRADRHPHEQGATVRHITDTEGNGTAMSYGHADNIIGPSRPTPPQTPTPPIDPALWSRPELAPVLATHDMCTLFRLLGKSGIGQRRIAELIGRSQSRVSEIAHGRQVLAYTVLVDIAHGLGIPPERMGLSWWGPDGRWYGPEDTYPGGVTDTDTPEGVDAAMLRRHLIAWGGVILAGAPVDKVGELLDDLGELPSAALPSQLGHGHVVKVRDLTRRLAEADNASVADPQVLSDAAARVSRLLDVPGPDPVLRALRVAVAELRIEAGWACFDAGLYHHALYHFAQALALARQAGDAYCQAIALGYAGLASIEHGHPNDGLKMKQAAQVAAWGIPSDDQRAVVVGESGRAAVEACQLVSSATALILLGEHTEAARMVARGRDLWTPTPADPFGDMDRPAARLEIERGRLDVAEQLAAASVRRWERGSLTSRTQSGIVLATIHVTAGEPRGLQLAHSAITDVTKLSSVRVRRQLVPLAEALETRPGTDAKDLARMARQVAA